MGKDGPHRGGDITFVEAVGIFRLRWKLIAAITSFATVASIVGSLLLSNVYRGEVLVVPTSDKYEDTDFSGQFDNIARVAGIEVGGRRSKTDLHLAMLMSRTFLADFIRDHGIDRALFEDRWDAGRDAWSTESGGPFGWLMPSGAPSEQEADRAFRKFLVVDHDTETGLVTVAVDWYDPELAAKWANQLVKTANEHIRRAAIDEAERNMDFLEEELESSSIQDIREALFGLVEVGLRNKMMAGARPEYAFITIDSAVVPDRKIRPKRAVIVILFTLMGFIFACGIALYKELIPNAL